MIIKVSKIEALKHYLCDLTNKDSTAYETYCNGHGCADCVLHVDITTTKEELYEFLDGHGINIIME